MYPGGMSEAVESPLVIVCDACLTASCWQGSFPCEKARSAGTSERTVAELDALGREHPSHYSGPSQGPRLLSKRLWLGSLLPLFLLACEQAVVCDLGQQKCTDLLNFFSHDRCLAFADSMNTQKKDPLKIYVCH